MLASRYHVSPGPVRRRFLEDVNRREVQPSREFVDALARDDAVPVAIAGEQDDGSNVATVCKGLEHAQGGRDPDSTGDETEAGAFVFVDREHPVRAVHVDHGSRLDACKAGTEVASRLDGELEAAVHLGA